MADKEIKITARYDGKSAEADAKKSFSKITGTAKDSAKKTGTMVDKNMGQAMSQFNEKTEKGRQLMTAFGGTLGAAGGQATYYAGTLSYVVGRFKMVELGVMALIGGLVALGKAIYDMTEGAYQEMLEKTRKLREETNKLTDSIITAAEEAMMTSEQVKRHQLLMQRVDLESQLLKLTKERDDRYGKMLAKGIDPMGLPAAISDRYKELSQEINKTEIAMGGLDFAMQKVSEAAAVKRAKDEAKAAEDKTGGGGPGGRGFWDEFGFGLDLAAMEAQADLVRDIQDRARREAEKVRKQDERDRKIAQEQEAREQEAHMWRMINLKEREERMKTQIAEREARIRERQQDETLRNSIALFEEIGNLLVQGEEQRKAVRIASIILQAGYEAAMEIAAGWAAYPDPVGMAAHFTAAALYGAVAAGKVATAASAGGGGSRGSVGERQARQGGRGENPWQTEKRETTIIVQLGGREVGRAIHEQLEGYYDSRNPGRFHSTVGY